MPDPTEEISKSHASHYGKWRSCDEVTNVTEYLNGLHKCFTLFHINNSTKFRHFVNSRGNYGQYLYEFYLKFDVSDSLMNDRVFPYRLFLHHPFRTLTGFETNFIDLL